MSVSKIVVLEIGRFLYFVGAVALVYLVGFVFGVVSMSPSLVSSIVFVSVIFYVLEFVFDMVS